MSNNDARTITIRLLEKSFAIKCPPDQLDNLQKAANLLEEKMRNLKGHNRDAESLSVICALNICHELINNQKYQKEYIRQMNERISQLEEMIENLLKEEELDV